MSESVVLLEKRDELGTRAVRKLREKGVLPGVVYGGGKPPVPVKSSDARFLHLIESGARVVRVKLDGEEFDAVVKEVHRDWLRDRILHIDLQRIVVGERVRVNVSITVKGEPKGVEAGGILEQHMREVEIECDPSEVPDCLVVDIGELGIGDSIHISELPLPEGAVVDIPGDTPVITVVAPAVMEEEEEVVEEVLKEPEVIKPEREEESEEEEGKE